MSQVVEVDHAVYDIGTPRVIEIFGVMDCPKKPVDSTPDSGLCPSTALRELEGLILDFTGACLALKTRIDISAVGAPLIMGTGILNTFPSPSRASLLCQCPVWSRCVSSRGDLRKLNARWKMM